MGWWSVSLAEQGDLSPKIFGFLVAVRIDTSRSNQIDCLDIDQVAQMIVLLTGDAASLLQ